MAPKTKFLTNDAATRKKWARDLFSIIYPNIEVNYLLGTGSDAIIQVRNELGKGEGDQIKMDIRLPLSGTGIVGDNTVEGNEEKISFRNFYLTIEELNHAVDTGGRMEEQRVPYNLMTEGKAGLQEWWVERLSDYAVNNLVGNSAFVFCGRDMSASSTAFAQAIAEPNSNQHMFMNGAASEAALTSADTVDLGFLDAMKQRAEIPNTDCFKVRPLKMGGKNYFRVMMHNYMFDSLRRNTNVGEWGDLQRAAGKLKMPEVEIEYNGLLISKSERVPRTNTSNSTGSYDGVYRCVLLGAQAACWAWGGAGESKSTTMSFVPYTKDAERFVMIRGGGIFGCKAVSFTTSGDYGRVVGSAWADRLQ
jgi:N4-gp56 family major capsid protein